MAKSTPTGPRVKSIRKNDQPHSADSGAVAVEEPPTPFDEEAAEPEPEPEPPPIAPEAPKKPLPRHMTFFQRVATIEKADWGTRAKIKVYRLGPIIDRLRGSENKYITIYHEAITEERLKIDHGSGRYRLYLSFKTAGTKQEKELDMIEIDILDMQFPPKVPPGEWVDDHRNKQWAWARQPTTPAAAPPSAGAGLADFVDVMRATSDLRKEIREEMEPATPAAPSVPPPPDPFDTAKKIMEMRANDPMVAMLMSRMESMDRAAEAARQREFDLQKELRQNQAAPAAAAAAAPKSLVEQVTELSSVKDSIGKLFGVGDAAAAKPGKFAWLADVGDVLERAGPILAPVAQGFGNWLSSKAFPAQPVHPAPMNGHTPPPAQVNPPPADRMGMLIREVITPAMLTHFDSGDTGSDFAAWLYNGMPNDFDSFQQFRHPMLPGLVGAPAIIEGYKHSSVWSKIMGKEAEFSAFVNEFCAWKKPGEEDEPAGAPAGVIDLDAEPVGDIL